MLTKMVNKMKPISSNVLVLPFYTVYIHTEVIKNTLLGQHMPKMDGIVTSMLIKMGQKGPIFLKSIDEILNFFHGVSETVLRSIYAHRKDKTTFNLINICPWTAEMDEINVILMLTKMGRKGPIFFKFIDEIQIFFHRV